MTKRVNRDQTEEAVESEINSDFKARMELTNNRKESNDQQKEK